MIGIASPNNPRIGKRKSAMNSGTADFPGKRSY
jgi:hypothetical protein